MTMTLGSAVLIALLCGLVCGVAGWSLACRRQRTTRPIRRIALDEREAQFLADCEIIREHPWFAGLFPLRGRTITRDLGSRQ